MSRSFKERRFTNRWVSASAPVNSRSLKLLVITDHEHEQEKGAVMPSRADGEGPLNCKFRLPAIVMRLLTEDALGFRGSVRPLARSLGALRLPRDDNALLYLLGFAGPTS